jgi:hypothetical protein
LAEPVDATPESAGGDDVVRIKKLDEFSTRDAYRQVAGRRWTLVLLMQISEAIVAIHMPLEDRSAAIR